MEGEDGGGAAVAAVLAAALPPGHELGDCNPETQDLEGLEKWLKTLGGKIAADAAPFVKLLRSARGGTVATTCPLQFVRPSAPEVVLHALSVSQFPPPG